MKFPYSMLLDFVETDLSAEQAGDLLTMAGFELEGIEEVEGEAVLDIKVMSNRGDGLSMHGLAREVLAKDLDSKPTDLYLRASKYFHVQDHPKASSATIQIETEDCSRYACRIFSGVENGFSPEWIQTRLRKVGQRPISFLVDLTNYVMLELGQPLHTFDLDKLVGGKIVVRKAREGEALTTLDGKEHRLRPDQMMICDAERPIAAAGIMGGENTEVSSETTNVLLESAHFDARSVRRTRKQLGLSTEASYRFERSVDPQGVAGAIERFTELLGQSGSEIEDAYPGKIVLQPVKVRVDRARTLLGMAIKDEEAQHYLQRLGMEVAGHGDPFYVVPPTWRPDITREIDLIEELGRVHGYDRIPEQLPSGTTTLGIVQGDLQKVDQLREATVREGYIQIMAHTLWSEHPLDAKGEKLSPRVVASPDYAFARNSLLPGLAEAFARNGGKNLHLFELGKAFAKTESATSEKRHLALLSSGELTPSYRKGEVVPQADLFSLKGDLERIFGAIGKPFQLRQSESIDTRFHPTRQGTVTIDGIAVGIAGQIHPEIASEIRLEAGTYLAEIDLDAVFEISDIPLKIRSISRNPAVRRDIALLIDKEVPFSQIGAAMEGSAGDVLEKFWVFDDFDGAGIPEGKHSLGIAMQLRKIGENFTDQEANQVRDEVVEALVGLGGTPR